MEGRDGLGEVRMGWMRRVWFGCKYNSPFLEYNNYLAIGGMKLAESKNQGRVKEGSPKPTHCLSYKLYDRREFKNIISILKNLARTCTVCPDYPILHILRTICRKFMVNQVEGLFLAYLVGKTRWNIEEEVIRGGAGSVRSIMGFIRDEEQYKKLVLYLTLLIYSLKEYLN